MENKFSKIIRVRLYRLVLVVLFVATAVCGFIYLKTRNPKLEAILAGLATGLFIAGLQYLLDWNEHVEIEMIKRLGIRRVLSHRDEKDYYRKLINQARGEILVLGNTALRLLEDFAHETRSDSKALLEALGRGVKVRILLPGEAYLTADDRQRSLQSTHRMAQIARVSDNFKYRYFDHPPSHSLMRIDDECLVGPIFPGVKSKDSPAIHVDAESPIAAEYVKYFEKEWNRAKEV